jgi:hypothetical protein
LITSETLTGTVNELSAHFYDNDFRLSAIAVNGGGSVSLGYDSDGLLISVDGLALARNSNDC